MAGFGKREPGDAPLEIRPQLRAANPTLDAAQKHSFPIIAGVVVLVASVIAWNVIPSRHAAAATPAEIALEAHLDEHPGLERLHAVLEAHYPKDFKDVVKHSQSALKRGDLAGPTLIGHRIFAKLAYPQLEHLDNASGSTLQVWARATLKTLSEVQQVAPDKCGHLPSALSSLSITAHPEVADSLNAFAAATLNGIYEGKTKPRNYDAPAEQDFATFGQAILNQGDNVEKLASITSDQQVDKLPGPERCDLTVKVFRAMQNLPEPSRSRILSAMATKAIAPL